MHVDPGEDPVVDSYDIFLTNPSVARYVLQYAVRGSNKAYGERHGQKPMTFRLKPRTGLVEVDIPINTRANYDQAKGLQFGTALERSRVPAGGYGMSGGFSSSGQSHQQVTVRVGGGGSRVKTEDEEETRNIQLQNLVRAQTLAGRMTTAEDDSLYMLAAFRGSECGLSFFLSFFFSFIFFFQKNNYWDPSNVPWIYTEKLHLSMVNAVFQMHPQLHHLDALDEMPSSRGGRKSKKDAEEEKPIEAEARTVDVKVKGAEEEQTALAGGNLHLLKEMQEDKCVSYDGVDAEVSQTIWPFFFFFFFLCLVF